jgi:hypothetical protein
VEYNTIDSNSLSKQTLEIKIWLIFPTFKKTKKQSLKAFIDVNRMDYALKFKISGDLKKANEYYKASPKKT